MKNNFKNSKTQKKGFTLIEALVGITILLVSVIGPLYIAFQGISLSILAKNQVIASYLAQEGIEFVRFRIDTNSNMGNVGNGLISSGSAYDLSDCSWQSNGNKDCTVDVFNNTTANCDVYALPDNTCDYIKYDSPNKRYNYSDGDKTFFRRSIRINHQPALGVNDIEFQVESKVEWGRPDDLRSIVIKEVIRDWRP